MEYHNSDHNQTVLRLADEVLEWARDLFMFGYKVKFQLGFPYLPEDSNSFHWRSYDPIDDEIGAVSHGLFCIYTEAFKKSLQLTQLNIEMEVWDHDGPQFPVLALGTVMETYLSFSRLPWIDAPAHQFQNIIPPLGSTGLPAPLIPATLDLRVPRFRFSLQPSSGKLNYLGAAVHSLQERFGDQVIATDNAFNSKLFQFRSGDRAYGSV